MPAVSINWWAYAAAVIISLIVGAIWYSPFLYGKIWSKLTGKKRVKTGDGYIIMAIAALVQVWVLVHFVRYAGAISAGRGAEVGFWLWLAFVALVLAGGAVFESRPWRLWDIDAGYYLAVMLINGALLAAWH